MKTRSGYWIAGGLGLAGVVGGVLWLLLAALTGYEPLVDGFLRAPVPGRTILTFTARTYYVYDEAAGASVMPVQGISITDVQTGRELAVRPSENLTETYSLPGRNGMLRGTVSATHGGPYLVQTVGGQDNPGATVAFGDSLLAPLGRQLTTAIAFACVLASMGLGLSGVTFARQRAARQISSSARPDRRSRAALAHDGRRAPPLRLALDGRMTEVL